jgi:hypothetical protein
VLGHGILRSLTFRLAADRLEILANKVNRRGDVNPIPPVALAFAEFGGVARSWEDDTPSSATTI